LLIGVAPLNSRMRFGKLLTILIFIIVPAVFSSAQTQPEPGTGIEGVVTIAPIHPGPAVEGMPSSTPLTNTTFVVENEKGMVTSFTTDDQGRFRVSLAPGHYTVFLKGKKQGVGSYGPFDVDVVAGRMTKVQWECDTGMR
jgi:hypothetical protein